METLGSLIMRNTQFDHDYGITQDDVIMVNELRIVIESTRSKKKPIQGDRIICQGPKREYKFGHLEKPYTERYSSICTKPCIPFVFIHKEPDGSIMPWFNCSGGYWLNETNLGNYRFINEPHEKVFCAFGHCGPCAGGAINFTARVNSWSIFQKGIY